MKFKHCAKSIKFYVENNKMKCECYGNRPIRRKIRPNGLI